MTATRQQQIDLGSFLERKRLTVPMFLERYNINGSTEALQSFIRAGNWVLAPELQTEIERAQNKLLEASAGKFVAAPEDVGDSPEAQPQVITAPAVTTASAASDTAAADRPKAAQRKSARAKATTPAVPRP